MEIISDREFKTKLRRVFHVMDTKSVIDLLEEIGELHRKIRYLNSVKVNLIKERDSLRKQLVDTNKLYDKLKESK
jgi:hypothetical protein